MQVEQLTEEEKIKEMDRDQRWFFFITGLSILVLILIVLVTPTFWDRVDNINPFYVILSISGIALVGVIRFFVVRRKMW